MENKEIIRKLNSIELCLMSHPENELNSEFADRISDLKDITQHLTTKTIMTKNNKKQVENKFSEFHFELSGYDFFYNGNRVYRFELFAKKINAEDLFSGRTKYSFKERPPYVVI